MLHAYWRLKRVEEKPFVDLNILAKCLEKCHLQVALQSRPPCACCPIVSVDLPAKTRTAIECHLPPDLTFFKSTLCANRAVRVPVNCWTCNTWCFQLEMRFHPSAGGIPFLHQRNYLFPFVCFCFPLSFPQILISCFEPRRTLEPPPPHPPTALRPHKYEGIFVIYCPPGDTCHSPCSAVIAMATPKFHRAQVPTSGRSAIKLWPLTSTPGDADHKEERKKMLLIVREDRKK